MVRDSTKDMGANTVCALCVSPAVDGIVLEHDAVGFVAAVEEVVAMDALGLVVSLAVVVLIVAEVVGGWEIGFGG